MQCIEGALDIQPQRRRLKVETRGDGKCGVKEKRRIETVKWKRERFEEGKKRDSLVKKTGDKMRRDQVNLGCLSKETGAGASEGDLGLGGEMRKPKGVGNEKPEEQRLGFGT